MNALHGQSHNPGKAQEKALGSDEVNNTEFDKLKSK
jgi:hypothetical protein